MIDNEMGLRHVLLFRRKMCLEISGSLFSDLPQQWEMLIIVWHRRHLILVSARHLASCHRAQKQGK